MTDTKNQTGDKNDISKEILEKVYQEHLLDKEKKAHPERWKEARNIGNWIR